MCSGWLCPLVADRPSSESTTTRRTGVSHTDVLAASAGQEDPPPGEGEAGKRERKALSLDLAPGPVFFFLKPRLLGFRPPDAGTKNAL